MSVLTTKQGRHIFGDMARPEMITIKEFAELIGGPYHTVRRWVSWVLVPGVEPIVVEGRGPVYHVPRAAVLQFKEEQPRRCRPPSGSTKHPKHYLANHASSKLARLDSCRNELGTGPLVWREQRSVTRAYVCQGPVFRCIVLGRRSLRF